MLLRVAQRLVINFYPRPPRGGRPANTGFRQTKRTFLSTPSARRATTPEFLGADLKKDFYPRPPRGGRLIFQQFLFPLKKFLSTPSARRATCASGERKACKLFLSTPSARRATYLMRYFSLMMWSFLSTPSARRATTVAAVYRTLYEFLSTPSARRATQSPRARAHVDKDFYPRPPRGGRRAYRRRRGHGRRISIHALREEGDRRTPSRASLAWRFLSTPSARRATWRCTSC